MGEDARDGVAAAVVLAEDLAEEAPDGSDRVEQPVAERTPCSLSASRMLGSAQGVGEGQSLVAREASADLLQGGQRGSQVSWMRGRWKWHGPRATAAAPGRAESRRREVWGAAKPNPDRHGTSRDSLHLHCTL